jgi:hypothetical protein
LVLFNLRSNGAADEPQAEIDCEPKAGRFPCLLDHCEHCEAGLKADEVLRAVKTDRFALGLTFEFIGATKECPFEMNC